MFVFWPPEKSEKLRSGARRKIRIFWFQILLRNFNFRLAVGGDPSKPHMISFHEVELNRNKIELNWIENSLSWSWIEMLWIEIEIASEWIELIWNWIGLLKWNRLDIDMDWSELMLILISDSIELNWNSLQLKRVEIEFNWNCFELNRFEFDIWIELNWGGLKSK